MSQNVKDNVAYIVEHDGGLYVRGFKDGGVHTVNSDGTLGNYINSRVNDYKAVCEVPVDLGPGRFVQISRHVAFEHSKIEHVFHHDGTWKFYANGEGYVVDDNYSDSFLRTLGLEHLK